jgi:hypothetical protein
MITQKMSGTCLRYSVIGIAVAGLFFGCGKKDDSEDSSDATVLEGTWSKACYAFDADNDGTDDAGFKISVTFTGHKYTRSFEEHKNDTCTSLYSSDIETGTFSIGNAVAGDQGATELDLVPVTNTMTPETADAASSFNDDKQCAKADWVVATAKDVKGLTCDDDKVGEPGYEIFKIDGKTLMMGDGETGDGSTAAKRPTGIDSKFVMTKS